MGQTVKYSIKKLINIVLPFLIRNLLMNIVL